MLLDLLLPRRCVVCAAPGPQLCPPCSDALPRLTGPLCARCGAPTAWPVARCRECSGRRLGFASARAAVAYDDAVRKLVSGWKERGLRRLAEPAAALAAAVIRPPPVVAVTFVPPDSGRRRRRGEHPAEALASRLGAAWGVPVELLLVRSGHAPKQRGLSQRDRRRNVRGAFAPARRSPASVALVDDVYTTGATVSAAATALRRGGARRVVAVTFARAVR
ncbi:MAG: ComF family protein [Actinobacteria bacterium]|nr:ComF family protein [Actinomycetota bacterium]